MKAVFCAKNKIVKTGISCHSEISDVAKSDESWEHCYSRNSDRYYPVSIYLRGGNSGQYYTVKICLHLGNSGQY